MVSDELRQNLPEDPWLAIEKITRAYFESTRIAFDDDGIPNTTFLRDCIGYLAFLQAFCRKHDIDLQGIEMPEVTAENAAELTMREIRDYIGGVADLAQRQLAPAQYAAQLEGFERELGTGFFYEFSEHEIEDIQRLINELRELISTSDLFEADHKRRLLKRLERLQSEVHKRVSDLDRLWGLVGDAGVAIGKFGKEAKPFVDRIRELAGIAWKAQSRAEQLPPSDGPPLLTTPPSEE